MSAANDSQMFEQMKRFADFGQRDSDLLAGLLLTAEPHLDGIVERFYDRIDETGETRLVVETHSSRARLSGTLGVWIRELLAGPHDDAYYVKRCRIGRMHVKIGLKPHYVFTALTILRVGLVEVATAEQAASLHRLMDIELAIINQVYWGDVTEALKRSERLATIGELGASLAHEIRNPLAAMQNSAFLLRQSAAKGGPPAGKYLGVLDTAIDECSRLVTSMLEFARSSKSSFCAISTPGLVRMAVVH
ncbi:MAG: two-component system sensor histidine kinase HydH, partial [Myxococcota bacterium]